MSDEPAPGSPPRNVRVVDRITGLEFPVDTIAQDERDENGHVVYEVVNLPEWFDPGSCTVRMDTMPPGSALRLKVELDERMLNLPSEVLVGMLRKASHEAHVHAQAGEMATVRARIFFYCLWLIFLCFMSTIVFAPWGVDPIWFYFAATVSLFVSIAFSSMSLLAKVYFRWFRDRAR